MKIGIEIHQRLDTGKLFCSCPSLIADDVPSDFSISRKLHPVLSELGEVDLASKKEFQKQKTFSYTFFNCSNCLVELDEEPPHSINKKALEIALEISMHLGATLVDEIHVMRKIVIDGSNTSGFQRTAFLALNGKIETSEGDVRITSIALEEESAGIIEKTNETSMYRLDRLGIPLIEITTEPDIKNGIHLKETAEKLGSILRSTGKVMRGLGTIRQDVNVSIGGGTRVEIKGAQNLKLLPLLLENEVKRQKTLLQISQEIKKRWGGPPKLKSQPIDISKLFSSTISKLISLGLSKGHSIIGLKLAKYSGLLGKELQKGRRYGSELSDYAKGAGVKGIIHSDEDLSKYKISENESNKIKEELKTNKEDAFILVVAPKEIALKALENVVERASILEIPGETRKANQDGCTSFMRPITGRARMYPETDTPPVELTSPFLKEIQNNMSLSLEEKKNNLEKLLNKEMAKRMLNSRNLKLFEFLVKEGHDPMLVASTLENTLIALRRDGVTILDLQTVLIDLFDAYKKDEFVKSAIPDLLICMSQGKSISKSLDENSLHKLKGAELEKLVKKLNYDLKHIMREYRLRVDPSDVMKLVKNK